MRHEAFTTKEVPGERKRRGEPGSHAERTKRGVPHVRDNGEPNENETDREPQAPVHGFVKNEHGDKGHDDDCRVLKQQGHPDR